MPDLSKRDTIEIGCGWAGGSWCVTIDLTSGTICAKDHAKKQLSLEKLKELRALAAVLYAGGDKSERMSQFCDHSVVATVTLHGQGEVTIEFTGEGTPWCHSLFGLCESATDYLREGPA